MAAFFAGSITSNLKFTAKVPLLMKATSNDEKPTQGYNLQEISTISKSSLPNCQSLLTFLLGRLEKKDPRIKFKVLHLMKYLVINGHSEFRARLRHNAEAVKKAVNFQGELDSVHGDGLNLKVQQAASELEKLLFDVDNPEIESIYKSMLGPDQSGKKMQGFGYTAAQEIKKETSFMDTLMKVKKSSSEIFNKSRAPQNVRFNEYEQTSTTPEAQYIPVDIEDSGVHPSSNFSSFDGNDEDEICDENEMNSDHYYERKLVQNITAEGGLTKIPSKEMLKDFMNKSSSLEIPVILEILDERLQSSSLNVQLKSLCVVEYMLRSNLSNVPREINEHCPSIHLLAESQDLTVQAKANKIVLAIASCLKQDENQPASRAQVVIPPNYNEAKEIPKMKDKSSSETDHKVTRKTDFNALFSGMNLSAGARPDFAVNRKLVEPTEPLIDIENTTASTSTVLENSDFLADTNESNSKQNPTENDKQTNGEASNLFSSKHTNSEVHANQFALAASSETQNSNNFDLMSLETSETSILDFSTPLQARDLSLLESNELKSNLNVHDIGQEPDKRSLRQEGRLLFNPRETTARPGVSWTNHVDVLNWKQSNSASSSSRTNSTQNIELLNTEPQNPNPPKSLPQKASHINPNRTVQCIPQNQNSDLLSFQPEPRSQALPGGLALPTNSSSASPRRPFPKDMKSETDGFDFIRKSTKADAFSFINDEIQASKTKQK